MDAFREMMRLQDELTTKSLRLSPEDILASTCPPCFGPEVPGKRPAEPNVVVCLDGNFQHRRHEAASAVWRGETGLTPALFLAPDEIKWWEEKMAKQPVEKTRAKLIVSCGSHIMTVTNINIFFFDHTGPL